MSGFAPLIEALGGAGSLEGLAGDVRVYVQARRLLASIARADGRPSKESAVRAVDGDGFDFEAVGIGMYAGRLTRFGDAVVDAEGRVSGCTIDGIPIGRLVRSYSSQSGPEGAAAASELNAVVLMEVPWSGKVEVLLFEGGPLDWGKVLASRPRPELDRSHVLRVGVDTVFGEIRDLIGPIGYALSGTPLIVCTYQFRGRSTVFPGECVSLRLADGRVLVPDADAAGPAAGELVPLAPLARSDAVRMVWPTDGGGGLGGSVVLDLSGMSNRPDITGVAYPSLVHASVMNWIEQEVGEGYFDLGVPEVAMVWADDRSVELRFEPSAAAVLAIHHLSRRLNPLGVRGGPIVMTVDVGSS